VQILDLQRVTDRSRERSPRRRRQDGVALRRGDQAGTTGGKQLCASKKEIRASGTGTGHRDNLRSARQARRYHCSMQPVIAKGTCFPMFAFEVAQSIDLDAAQRRMQAGAERQTIKYKRRAPASFEYRPAPLHVTRGGELLEVNGRRTTPGVEVVLYDFGA